MKEKRDMLSASDVAAHSHAVVTQIENLPFYADVTVIGAYKAFNNEIDLSGLTHPDAVIVYPKVVGTELRFILPKTSESFAKSMFGVMEPTEGVIMDDVIDLLLVPALAISEDLHRIGYGKGFYDRFIGSHRPKHVIGVIHDFQLIDTIDNSPEDQRLDMVLTEKT